VEDFVRRFSPVVDSDTAETPRVRQGPERA
jgi:hypothetical protein